jgi:sorbitol/mannitol transport system substrate-binding protein
MALPRRVLGVGAVAVVVLASGCAGAGGGSGSDGKSVNVLMVNNPQMLDLQKLTAANFTKQTGIKVNFTVLPENDVRDKISQEFSSQSGNYDVASISNYEVPIYAKNKWLVSLDDSVAKDSSFDQADILPPMREGMTGEDGKLYGEPFYGESSFLMYRADVFKAKGLNMPAHPTWQQVADLAAKTDGAQPGMKGICLRGLPGWGEVFAPLTTVVSGANSWPHPGCPRRQMPFMFGCAPSAFVARSATSCHVGLAGMVRPLASNTSLRYMRNEDSP